MKLLPGRNEREFESWAQQQKTILLIEGHGAFPGRNGRRAHFEACPVLFLSELDGRIEKLLSNTLSTKRRTVQTAP